MHCNWGVAPTCHRWRKPTHSNKDPEQPSTITKKKEIVQEKIEGKICLLTQRSRSVLFRFLCLFFFFFFLTTRQVGSHLRSGIEPMVPPLEAQNLYHWTAREVPFFFSFFFFSNGVEFVLRIIPPCLGVPFIVYSPAKCSWSSGHRPCL